MANTITREQGCWIQYQLKLNGYIHEAVAREANRSVSIVTKFLNGCKGSDAVPAALYKLLGYESFDALLTTIPHDCRARNGKGESK
jgi:hypothetical protein